MHKRNKQQKPIGAAPSDTDQPKPGMTPQAIWETMNHPEFDAEQLPELWQQAMEPDDTSDEQDNAWHAGTEAMYRRCETYPQYAKMYAVLSGMSRSAWRSDGWTRGRADGLLEKATTGQLLQALTYGQRHPESWWQARTHILAFADLEQLTGPVIALFEWNHGMAVAAGTEPDEWLDDRSKWRSVVEEIRQHMLEGDNNAWNLFLHVVEPGTFIGEAVALAKTVEQQTGPARKRT